MKKLLITIALAGLLLIAGCGPQDPATTTTTTTTTTQTTTTTTTTSPAQLTTAEQHALLARGNTDFALDLYRLMKEDGGNMFYSPYSISSVMAMVYAGANGETADEIKEALSFDLPEDYLHPSFLWLQKQLASRSEAYGSLEPDEMFKLHTVNDVWGQEDYDYVRAFLDILEDNYGAGLREMDFIGAPEDARLTINDYIADQTEDRIQDLIPQGAIDPMTRLVLTNAIYFNATWFWDFWEGNTAPADFHLLDGGSVNVDMMHQSNSFGYDEGDDYQAVEMFYRGSQTSMVVILPEDGAFEPFEDSLDTDVLNSIIAGLEHQKIVLSFPKYEFEASYNLNEILAELGMPLAFTGQADFSGMTDVEPLWISEVVHKSFVSVDEKGTEAAAATAAMMACSAAMDPPEMTVDRPFIFLIRDIETDTILFMGRVLDPSAG